MSFLELRISQNYHQVIPIQVAIFWLISVFVTSLLATRGKCLEAGPLSESLDPLLAISISRFDK